MSLKIDWRLREPPLPPIAVCVQGDAALVMARHLLARSAEERDRLQGVSGRNLLVLIGESAALPWVDGALYLGRDPEAPALLLPTTQQPSIPLALLESALRRHAPGLNPPLAVLPGQSLLLSLSAARLLDSQTLQRWLEAHS